MSKFAEVFKNRNFLFLWLGQIISQVGDRLNQLALIAFVYLRTPGSSLQMAKVLSFTIIPVFLIGPLAGVYVDRWNRRRTMYICDFLRSCLVLTIPLFLFYTQHISYIYIIIFLVFCIGRFFIPAKLALIPDLVKKKDLLIANSLVNTTGMIAAILGFGIGGIVVEWVGAKAGFFLDSLSFFISGSLIFFIGKKTAASVNIAQVSREIMEVFKKSVLQEIKEGLTYFIHQKEIRFTASVLFLLWSAMGAVYIVLIVFVQNTLHSATKDLGFLIMSLGLGLLLGSLIYGRFGQRISHSKAIFSFLVLSGITLVVFAVCVYKYPYLFLAASLSLILGIFISPVITICNTVVHNISEGQMRGRIFSSMEIVMHLGFLLFMFISSILAERIPEVLILTIIGTILAIIGIINLIYQRRIPWVELKP
jgi:MFS family permease